MSKINTLRLVEDLKRAGEDFEWYPTTDEIIRVVKQDIENDTIARFEHNPSILDCGAGDGRVLLSFDKFKKYAIEKSQVHAANMPENIFIIGTDFHQQTLIDKKVSVIFCNPPYSEYEAWAAKIILQANSRLIYLVIPSRWTDSKVISEAISARKPKVSTIGNFSFENGDRAARANVCVIRICLSENKKEEAFSLWFKSCFPQPESKPEVGEFGNGTTTANSVMCAANYIENLQAMYEDELQQLLNAYQKIMTICPKLLKEIGVTADAVCKSLESKIEGLKHRYWHELFSKYRVITQRLIEKNRKKILNEISNNISVDFTKDNIYAITLWVIKNASLYLDDQLVDVYERMVEKANVVNYKSNQKTFTDERWRYLEVKPDNYHLTLENRIVLTRTGGLLSRYSWEKGSLSVTAGLLINDILTIAHNLGYSTEECPRAEAFNWESNKSVVFTCKDLKLNKDVTLMDVKAFKNGNIHIKFNQDFMLKFSVEFGRIKGWLKDKEDVVAEMGVPSDEAALLFNSSFRFQKNNTQLLGML